MTDFLAQVRADVTYDRNQTLGLSSCPDDAEGKECEICAEQVDRLVTQTVAATLKLAAERVRENSLNLHGADSRMNAGAREAADFLDTLREGL